MQLGHLEVLGKEVNDRIQSLLDGSLHLRLANVANVATVHETVLNVAKSDGLGSWLNGFQSSVVFAALFFVEFRVVGSGHEEHGSRGLGEQGNGVSFKDKVFQVDRRVSNSDGVDKVAEIGVSGRVGDGPASPKRKKRKVKFQSAFAEQCLPCSRLNYKPAESNHANLLGALGFELLQNASDLGLDLVGILEVGLQPSDQVAHAGAEVKVLGKTWKKTSEVKLGRSDLPSSFDPRTITVGTALQCRLVQHLRDRNAVASLAKHVTNCANAAGIPLCVEKALTTTNKVDSKPKQPKWSRNPGMKVQKDGRKTQSAFANANFFCFPCRILLVSRPTIPKRRWQSQPI